MNKGEELDLLVSIEKMKDVAPEAVPGFEAMYDILKFLEPSEGLLEFLDEVKECHVTSPKQQK